MLTLSHTSLIYTAHAVQFLHHLNKIQKTHTHNGPLSHSALFTEMRKNTRDEKRATTNIFFAIIRRIEKIVYKGQLLCAPRQVSSTRYTLSWITKNMYTMRMKGEKKKCWIGGTREVATLRRKLTVFYNVPAFFSFGLFRKRKRAVNFWVNVWRVFEEPVLCRYWLGY